MNISRDTRWTEQGDQYPGISNFTLREKQNNAKWGYINVQVPPDNKSNQPTANPTKCVRAQPC